MSFKVIAGAVAAAGAPQAVATTPPLVMMRSAGVSLLMISCVISFPILDARLVVAGCTEGRG